MVDIKTIIRQNGMTIQQVAEVLGMTRQGFYFHIQQGDKISVEMLQKIADVIGCNVTDFITTESNIIKCPHCGKKIVLQKGQE
jgi:transcriptional regulator with XRE-family HTH domain